ncbi:MAG: 3-phosphoshikimate 1-carboxyvinyltransferase, partial [Desulfovibrio sp.]|nr:3-phosphoshikimate 1-carboxyvinyltransferase [Desulfovibrio sp.]
MTDSSNDFRAAGPRRPNSPRRREGADARARRPLRDVVCEIDRDILRLLLRRTNLLTKMRGSKPRLEAAEEKALREAWEAAVARVSRDARLSGHFFSLMQEVEFLPRPAAHDEADVPEGAAAREPQHTAFNLAPAPKPVRLRLAAPL